MLLYDDEEEVIIREEPKKKCLRIFNITAHIFITILLSLNITVLVINSDYLVHGECTNVYAYVLGYSIAYTLIIMERFFDMMCKKISDHGYWLYVCIIIIIIGVISLLIGADYIGSMDSLCDDNFFNVIFIIDCIINSISIIILIITICVLSIRGVYNQL
jgi:hypothetical protein